MATTLATPPTAFIKPPPRDARLRAMHPPQFAAGPYAAVELGDRDVPRLQQFFDANPEYFLAVGGRPATASEAHDEVHSELPQGWPYTKLWVLGFEDEAGRLIGMASVVSDLLAPAVWHIGLFMVATGLHGSGTARTLYAALERWMREHGAQWLRLGVVLGNARAERFWERCGYRETRRREAVAIGLCVNTIRVMAKPLAGGTMAHYLGLVPRDRPDSA